MTSTPASPAPFTVLGRTLETLVINAAVPAKAPLGARLVLEAREPTRGCALPTSAHAHPETPSILELPDRAGNVERASLALT